jgi:hypothetical protein
MAVAWNPMVVPICTVLVCVDDFIKPHGSV